MSQAAWSFVDYGCGHSTPVRGGNRTIPGACLDCQSAPVPTTEEGTQLMTENDARAWLAQQLLSFGHGFHWDTRGEDYLEASGEPTFSSAAAAAYDLQAERAYAALSSAGHDPYGLALGMLTP
jgi:hypothetical protein